MVRLTEEELDQVATEAYNKRQEIFNSLHEYIDKGLMESAKAFNGAVVPKYITIKMLCTSEWPVLVEQLKKRFPTLDIVLKHNDGNATSNTWDKLSIIGKKYSLFIDDGVSH
jgi:hypothetical protein